MLVAPAATESAALSLVAATVAFGAVMVVLTTTEAEAEERFSTSAATATVADPPLTVGETKRPFQGM